MANYNLSGIKKIVNKLGITCQLVPSDAQPLNCKYVIVNGVQLKSSQWSKTEAEAILSQYTDNPCKQQLKAFDEVETLNNNGNIKELIHFENETLTYCLEEFRKLTEKSHVYSLNNWIKTMTDFFTNEVSGKTDVDACAIKVKNMIDTKEVHILNNFVYTNLDFTNVIKAWQEANNIKQSINYTNVINKYVEAVNNVL